MNYDGFILAALSAEFRTRLIGGKVQHVRQHSDTDYTLEIRQPGRTERLLMSCDARFPRIYLTASREQAVPEPSTFCMTLRKHLEGLFLTQVGQIGMDRVLHLLFEGRNAEPKTLIIEIMGKHSNIVLVDETQKVLAAAKYVGTSISRVRQILPGKPYIPPPGEPKVDWSALDGSDARAICSQYPAGASPSKWLMQTFAGIGPFLAAEVVALAGESGSRCESLVSSLLDLWKVIHTNSARPVLIRHDGRDVTVYPVPSAQYPAQSQHPRDSMSEPVDALFRSRLADNRLEDERRQTLTAIERSLTAKRQFLESARRTIEEAERSEQYKQIGDLILAAGPAVQKGEETAQLVNYYEPEMPTIEVELDKELNPQENAQKYYRKYRKAKEALAMASGRLEVLEAEVAELEHACRLASEMESVEELKTLRDGLLHRGLLRQEKIQEHAEPDEFQGKHIRRIFTEDGYEILYGENAVANDYLTTRVAKPNDLWFHTRSIIGAHVVIRMAGKGGPAPKSAIEQAALIAAKNSDAKHSSLVPVDYTLRKHVRKPRGAAPGLVIYTHEKTVDVRMR